jgi:hypothetical protein
MAAINGHPAAAAECRWVQGGGCRHGDEATNRDVVIAVPIGEVDIDVEVVKESDEIVHQHAVAVFW